MMGLWVGRGLSAMGLRDLGEGNGFLSVRMGLQRKPETVYAHFLGTADEFGFVEVLKNRCLMIERPPDGLDVYRKCQERRQPL